MSRIGKQPIPVPAGVDVTIEGQSISVKGPKGTLGLTVAEPIKVARNDDGAIVSPVPTMSGVIAPYTGCPVPWCPTWSLA